MKSTSRMAARFRAHSNGVSAPSVSISLRRVFDTLNTNQYRITNSDRPSPRKRRTLKSALYIDDREGRDWYDTSITAAVLCRRSKWRAKSSPVIYPLQRRYHAPARCQLVDGRTGKLTCCHFLGMDTNSGSMEGFVVSCWKSGLCRLQHLSVCRLYLKLTLKLPAVFSSVEIKGIHIKLYCYLRIYNNILPPNINQHC